MSIRTIAAIAFAIAAVAGGALAVPATEAAPLKLLARVGPADTISLTSASGARVRTLKAGTYTVVVRDLSAEHNFVLRGPGVSKATSIEGMGTSTWRVKVARGKTYKFVCEPHADHMAGTFRGR
jgi:hypothetical protein